MVLMIIGLILAFLWLGYESDWMRVRLMLGESKPRYGVGRTMAQWKEYDNLHSRELKREQKEYAKRQAYIESHTCHACRSYDETILIETKTIVTGNSTCRIRTCPDCLAKYQKEIEKSQQPAKSRNPYPASHYTIGLAGGINYGYEQPYGDIEIKVDGEIKLDLNGNSGRGMVKDMMRQYCRPGEGKIKLVKVR